MKVRNIPVRIASIVDLCTALIELYSEGTPREKLSSGTLLKDISARWANMTNQEKHVATADKVRELEERRENRLEAVHNNNIAACHDARVTLANIKIEVSICEFLCQCSAYPPAAR